jgi:hypothetical protein
VIVVYLLEFESSVPIVLSVILEVDGPCAIIDFVVSAVAVRSKSMNCLRPLEHWDHGFKSHSRHVCLCAFILCLCCSVFR